MKCTTAVLCGLSTVLLAIVWSGSGAASGIEHTVAQSRSCCASAWCVEQGQACQLACERRPGTPEPAVSLEQCRRECGEHVRVCEECCRQPATQCWNPSFCW